MPTTPHIVAITLSVLSPLPALVIGYRNRKSLLWAYLLVCFSFDLLNVLLKRLTDYNYAWVGNVFMLTEFVLISFLFKDALFRRRRLFFYILLASLGVFFVINTIDRSPWLTNKNGGSVFTFVYILFAIVGFYTILKEQKVIFLDKYWFFWLNAAFLIYASGSFLLFLFRDYLKEQNNDLFVMLWRYLFLSLNITKNVLLAFAIYYFGRDKR